MRWQRNCFYGSWRTHVPGSISPAELISVGSCWVCAQVSSSCPCHSNAVLFPEHVLYEFSQKQTKCQTIDPSPLLDNFLLYTVLLMFRLFRPPDGCFLMPSLENGHLLSSQKCIA